MANYKHVWLANKKIIEKRLTRHYFTSLDRLNMKRLKNIEFKISLQKPLKLAKNKYLIAQMINADLLLVFNFLSTFVI